MQQFTNMVPKLINVKKVAMKYIDEKHNKQLA